MATTAAKTKQKIRIRLRGYDSRVVDRATSDIVETARRSGAVVCGPIPLPTKIEKFTVLSSPHVNKKAREQFEMRTHKRLIDLLNPTSTTIEKLRRHSLPSGVFITIATSTGS